MKNLSKVIVLVFLIGCVVIDSFSQSTQWKKIVKEGDAKTEISLLESSDEGELVEFTLNAYKFETVITPTGKAKKISIPDGAWIQQKGFPELQKRTQSILISDEDEMDIEIVSADYIEINNIDVSPSKGPISRNVDPETIPYEYNEMYQVDEFYPGTLARLGEPYVIRDYRGQVLNIFPLQYNPVTKIVKIYTNIVISIKPTGRIGNNVLKKSNNQSLDKTFHNVYSNHFLNYNNRLKYTPISENGGKMLVVSHPDFISAIQPFVDWKNSVGIQTEVVDYSTIGSSSALKTYVQNYYDQNDLTFLILVGDHQQVPSSYTSAGDSDNNYGYVAGGDHYLDVFVGRFSATTAAEVTNQVNKTIYYERDFAHSSPFILKGIGIASNEGGNGEGDDGESDEQHMNNIEPDLEGYGYSITRCYQDGGTATQLSNLVNSGSGIINYVGHGGDYNWVAPYFSDNHVNELTNTDSYPFVISVACVVGNFTNKTCFAEAWLRATHNGSPSGAVVFCGSTINQSWESPMCAQDEMNDLLVSNTLLTFGGIFANGMFQMIDEYGNDGNDMADTWTVFGDVSVQMRTPGHPDALIIDEEPPESPLNLECTFKSGEEIQIQWDAAIDNVRVGKYYIYVNSEPFDTIDGSKTNYFGTGFESYKTYSFCLKAVDPSGNRSAFSESLEVRTLDIIPPTSPLNLEVTGKTIQGVSLAWDASSDNAAVAEYEIFVDNILVGSVDTMELLYDVFGLDDELVYRFTIKAKDEAGNVSDTSNSVVGWPVIKIAENEQGVNSYPNPSDGDFVLEVSSLELGEMIIKVFNMNGSLVLRYTKEMMEEREKLRMHINEPGIYEVQVSVGSNIMTETLIIQ